MKTTENRNTNRCRAAAWILSLLMLVPTAVSCGDAGTTADTGTANAADTTDAATETADPNDRSGIKDNLPEGLDFGQREFRVYCGTRQDNEEYVAGPEEESGEIVEDAVRQRNLSVEERLNVKIISDSYDDEWNTINTSISKLVMAGDATYDLFMGQQAGVTKLITENCFVNAYDIEHLDFTQPWWNNTFMDELAVGDDYRFLLVGDYFISTLLWTRVIFFNKVFYAEYFDDADELYRTVLDGKWTLDQMADIAKQVYIDINNDGVTDEGDRLGMTTYLAMSSTDGFVYGTDIPFTKRDENGFVTLTLMSDDAVTLAEKLPAFFAQPGTLWKTVTGDEHNRNIFMEGNTMFIGNASLQDAKYLREMKDDFGFLPYPKFDEEQENYRSLVHDATLLGGISNASQNLDMAGAVIEALNAETYRTVTPIWYETALKIKYSRDDISAQMIDLIHASSSTNFIYAYNYALNNAGLIYRELCTNNTTDYASSVKKIEKTAARKLEKIVEIFEGSLDS